jgi:hypothetical protein
MYTADSSALATLKQYGCTYLGPTYDARTHRGPSPYCGAHDLVQGTLYCGQHYELMYVKGSALRKRTKDQRRANAIRELMSDFNAALEELESEGFDVYAPSDLEELDGRV